MPEARATVRLTAAALGPDPAAAKWRLDDLVGPRHRRLGDVGDGWRALLLGAPPRGSSPRS